MRKGEWQILGVVTTLTSVLRGQMGHKDVGQMGHMFSITTIQAKYRLTAISALPVTVMKTPFAWVHGLILESWWCRKMQIMAEVTGQAFISSRLLYSEKHGWRVI